MCHTFDLSRAEYEDVRIREHEKNGSFTVRSCYHMLLTQNRHQQQDGNEEISIAYKKLWKRIWGAKVPNKFRVFAWRISQEILPVRQKLYQRKICADSVCKKRKELNMH